MNNVALELQLNTPTIEKLIFDFSLLVVVFLFFATYFVVESCTCMN